MARIEAQLAVAKQSDRAEIISLANVIINYLEKEHLSTTKIGFWEEVTHSIDAFGLRFGRQKHRTIISIALIGWVILVAGYIAVIVRGGANLDIQVLHWRVPLIGIQIVIGVLLIFAAFFWLNKKKELGLKFGVSGFLTSLVALQLLYFYISQFSAITATLLQLAILQVLFAYRRWYLSDMS